MQHPKAFEIDPDALLTRPAAADRVVPLTLFVPCTLPGINADEPYALTPSQVDRLARTVALVRQSGSSDPQVGPSTLPSRVQDAAAQWRERAETETFIEVDPLLQSSVSPEVQISAQLATEFGWLFLDRTRIRPMGFALGEHLISLSLAPGEEVTIEQHTFSKIEQSFEETSDSEIARDLELSSSYTNELGESLDWQISLNKKSNNSSGAKASGSYEGIGIEASTQSASDLADGDTRTARDSVKLSETGTRKVASKQRQQHKIVMKLSQESRFESGSKRILRNPNELAPIDLVYFKIMQRLRVSQERFGVRLCWAPTVENPAQRLWADLETRRVAFMATAMAVDVGPAPVPPAAPASGAAKNQTVTILADKFDPVWGGQSADYTLDISAPVNYTWDRQPVLETFTFTGSRPAGASLLSAVGTMTGVRAIVHVGIEDCRNPFKMQWWQATGTATMELGATFLPTPDSAANKAYADAFAAYLQAMADWNARLAQAKAAAAVTANAAWAKQRADVLARLDPMQEVLGALIEQAFPRASRDAPWEIDFWERIFDFQHLSVRFYPAWWSHRELRDPDSPATGFLNASWARIFIPVRPDAEAVALRWLLARVPIGTAPKAVEDLIDVLVTQTRAYRLNNFGNEHEVAVDGGTIVDGCPTMNSVVRCLGSWEEVIPTDGTHLEVLQATTSAADDQRAAKLVSQNELLAQRAALVAKDVGIKAQVDRMVGLTSHVEIRVSGVPDTGNE